LYICTRVETVVVKNQPKTLKISNLKQVKMKNSLVVKGNKLVVATANVEKVATKKVKFREIFGIRLGAKPSIELKLAVKVLKANQDKSNMSFNFILSEYKKEMIRNDKKTDGKNFEGRLRRILYRSIESGITRESIQGIKFNLKANYKGIKVITSQPFVFNNSANVARKDVEENLYTFKFNKVVTLVTKAEIKTVSDKVKAFKTLIR
jgi:hypothetical protein